MRINITAGQTACPFHYAYDGSLGDDPVPLIELKNSDGSFAYDNDTLIERNADGSLYQITGEADVNGKFIFSYRFSLIGVTGNAHVSAVFPYTLPIVLQ